MEEKTFDKKTLKEQIGNKNDEKLTKIETNEAFKSQTETNKNEDKTIKTDTKSVGFWVGIVAVVLATVQIVLSNFGVQIEVKIIVEICAVVLAILAFFGVLKREKTSNSLTNTKDEIKKEIEDKIDKKN